MQAMASVRDMLHDAAWRGNVEELQRLLADPAVAAAVDWGTVHAALYGASEATSGGYFGPGGWPPEADCMHSFELLLEAAPGTAAARGPQGQTLLHVAARFGLLDAAELLLDMAPQTAAAVSHTGQTPLHEARVGLRDCICSDDESWRDGGMADTLLLMDRLLRAAPSALSVRSGGRSTPADLAHSLINYGAEDGEQWVEEHHWDDHHSQSQQLICNAAMHAARTLLEAHSRGEPGARPLMRSLKEVQQITEAYTYVDFRTNEEDVGPTGHVRHIREEKVVTTDTTISRVPVFARAVKRLALTPEEWALVPRGDPFLHTALPDVLERSPEEARLLLARLPQVGASRAAGGGRPRGRIACRPEIVAGMQAGRSSQTYVRFFVCRRIRLPACARCCSCSTACRSSCRRSCCFRSWLAC